MDGCNGVGGSSGRDAAVAVASAWGVCPTAHLAISGKENVIPKSVAYVLFIALGAGVHGCGDVHLDARVQRPVAAAAGGAACRHMHAGRGGHPGNYHGQVQQTAKGPCIWGQHAPKRLEGPRDRGVARWW